MTYLIDSNVLLRLAEPAHPMYAPSLTAITTLRRQQALMYIAPQNLIEFWVVATRPSNVNGLGMTVAQALGELTRIKSFFLVQPDTPTILVEWERLITQYQIQGKQAHDTRLVAVMIVYQLTLVM
ncbi:type II toxin-antitoxin system VapC family toxin [Leptolyngbya sp. AN03gr2]|uniref:type II toxin-antitoxin system VapC family toxin n=1 Tax=unclassified Leptolyngbya TaxID=2650499 RepID=UPI003D316F24